MTKQKKNHKQVHAQKENKHKSHVKQESVPACTSLGCKTESAFKPPKDNWPKDYKVANHGADHDVATTQNNAAAAEKKLGAWNPKQDDEGKFIVPQEDAEFKLTGTQTDVRLDSKSDPICSSAGCTQYKHPTLDKHPMNYFVPDFGKDHDIKQSENSASAAESKLGHTFTPKYDEEKDVWVVPTEDADFKLAGVSEDVRISKKKTPSDPSCSSAGWCGESLWPGGMVDEKHKVLRHDTKRGATQAPTEVEAKTNMDRIIKARPDPHPNSEEPEKDERRYDAQSLSQCQDDDDDNSCTKRKKSSLIGDEEWKKCHSKAQKKAEAQSLS